MGKLSYTKLNLMALGTTIISIVAYFGYIILDLFNKLSNNEYAILIVMAVILLSGVIGAACGIMSFFKIRKLEYNKEIIPRTDVAFTIIMTIANLGIVFYSFINLIVVIYFVTA